MRGVALLALLVLLPASASALPWPAGKGPPGKIQAGVQRWKSLEGCLEELSAQLPTEAASQVLGNDPVEAICVSRQAAAKDDPEVCRRGLKDFNQRNQCLRFFAIYTGRPADCPQRGWPAYREGLCAALASRQPSLCLAAPEPQRPLCRALLQGEAQCAQLGAPRRAACLREAAGWRGLLKPLPLALPAGFKPSLEMRASSISSGLTLPPGVAQLRSTALDTGVLLADQPGSGDWFSTERNLAPEETYQFQNRPALELELQVLIPGAGTGTVTVASGNAQGKVSFRESGSYRHRVLQASTGAISLTRLDRKLGGEIAGTFSLELSDGVDRMRLDGEFRTFARELVPQATMTSVMRSRSRSTSSYYTRGALSPEEVQKLQARLKKVSDNLYELDLSVREDLIADTGKLTDSAQISQDYRSKAFRLFSVQRTGLLGLLGFQDNDLLRKINGKEVKTREDLFEAYTRLKRSPSIVVLIERGGSETRLTYRFKKLPASK